MAGTKEGVFIQKLSPFLLGKLEAARGSPAENQGLIRVLEAQYLKDPGEDRIEDGERRRHYESEMPITFEGRPLRGVERLYRRSIVVQPTTVCAAHCRWCLRGRYATLHLAKEELSLIARYIGGSEVTQDLREVLITGGDPMMVPEKLDHFMSELSAHAPQLKILRIGTRVPLQEPARVTEPLVEMLSRHGKRLRIEVGLHVNHPLELFPEAVAALSRLRAAGMRFYDQTVLLKGVNDDPAVLVELFEALRELDIEAHYLFHCIPLLGMKAHRTSVRRGLELARELTSSGLASGRAKPMFTLMTDIGKVTPYEDTILERGKDGRILLQTGYRHADRLRWNPEWRRPESAQVDSRGYLRVWYLDGPEDGRSSP